ncbi:MAG TPA: glycerophosphoryl diester phosphodiesterase membrane domain-containing protein, partial [Terracidiphilus sp.]|nr:glycerophosphoryl diester phosphodiesterase membrane domain-containing protein [Terracidiphilus sp.]
SSPEDPVAAWRVSVLIWIIYSHIAGLVYPVFYPALAKAASAVYFEEPMSIAAALGFGLKNWRRWLWLDVARNATAPYLPAALGLSLLAAGSFAQDTLHWDPEGNVMTVVANCVFTAIVIACFWMGACISFAMPVAALENIGGFKAIRRSWRLSKGGRMRVFGSWIAIFLVTYVVWYAIQVLVRFGEWLLRYRLHLHFVNTTFHLVSIYSLAAIFNALTAPIYPVVVVLLYYNQRVRKEGYDIERMIEAAGLDMSVQAPVVEPSAAPALVAMAEPAIEHHAPSPTGESLA